MRRHLLVADVGGTKTLLQRVMVDEDGLHASREVRYPSADFQDLETLVEAFLKSEGEAPPIEGACLAIAAPIVDTGDGQRARVTNLPWELDSRSLESRCGIAQVRLVNDFEAAAYGIDTLTDEELAVLQRGKVRSGAPRLVVGAGTGLGVAQLLCCNREYQVVPSEGGHGDFAPADEVQIALLRDLMVRYGHVSVERLVSGSGLVAIYEFLNRDGQAQTIGALRASTAQDDAAAAVSAEARRDPHGTAARAVTLFIEIYGAVVGNLALVNLPYGGIYLAGGIAAKLLDRLRDGRFLDAMARKGRMTSLLADMPVAVVTETDLGLRGAARLAKKLFV
jgi:glucokinase